MDSVDLAIGVTFHSGKRFTQWRGNALLNGLSSMSLFHLTTDGRDVSATETTRIGKRIRDEIEAPDVAVLVLTDVPTGELLRLTPSDATR